MLYEIGAFVDEIGIVEKTNLIQSGKSPPFRQSMQIGQIIDEGKRAELAYESNILELKLFIIYCN